jgi:hypothetical protein
MKQIIASIFLLVIIGGGILLSIGLVVKAIFQDIGWLAGAASTALALMVIWSVCVLLIYPPEPPTPKPGENYPPYPEN